MHVVDRVSFNCSRSRCGSTNVRQFGLLYVGYAMLSTTILRVGQIMFTAARQRLGKARAKVRANATYGFEHWLDGLLKGS